MPDTVTTNINVGSSGLQKENEFTNMEKNSVSL
jgi:hypothetical protein